MSNQFMEKAIRLVESGGDINEKKNGLTLLHQAANINDMPTIKYLLENGADINILNSNRSTPLQYAISSIRPKIDTIKYLIDNGAHVDILDIDGKTLVERAKRYCDNDMVQFLESYASMPTKGVHCEL